jgi:hypothetical protein
MTRRQMADGKGEVIELSDGDRDRLPPIHGEAHVRRDQQ